MEWFRERAAKYTISYNWQRIDVSSSRLRYEEVGECFEFLRFKNLEGYDYFTIPLTEAALDNIKRIMERVAECDSSLFRDLTLHLCRIDSRSHPDDLILTPLVDVDVASGRLLSEYLDGDSSATEGSMLLQGVELLEMTLDEFNVGFEYLDPSKIIVGVDGRLYPFQYDKMRHTRTDDCATLRNLLMERYGEESLSQIEEEEMEPYPPREVRLEQYSYSGYPHCDLSLVESEDGLWGYVDLDGGVVVEPKYRQAFNFQRSGYAIVVGERGWGLCNREGVESISPLYEDLIYGGESDLCAVRSGGKWAYFSCNGGQLTPFDVDYPSEEITRDLLAQHSSTYKIVPYDKKQEKIFKKV